LELYDDEPFIRSIPVFPAGPYGALRGFRHKLVEPGFSGPGRGAEGHSLRSVGADRAELPNLDAWFKRHGWVHAVWVPLGTWVWLGILISSAFTRRMQWRGRGDELIQEPGSGFPEPPANVNKS